MLGTLIMIIALAWRFRSRQKGQDIGQSVGYMIFITLGLFWLFVLGGTGGDLVYEYGIGVRGVNPLLAE